MVAAQRTRELVVHVFAAASFEYAMRSEQAQYSVQSISVSSDLLGKIGCRPWLLIECVGDCEISYNVQCSRQPIPGRDLHQPHDRFRLCFGLADANRGRRWLHRHLRSWPNIPSLPWEQYT